MDAKAREFWTPFKLNNGLLLPAVGCSTFGLKTDEEVMIAIDKALGAGYRLFDTSCSYANEALVGKALKICMAKYGISRDEIFVTGKLKLTCMYSSNIVKKAYDSSVKNLGIDYFDLFLVQLPMPNHVSSSRDKHLIYINIAWTTLVELYDGGIVNAIGVSNFTTSELADLIKNHHEAVPSVNQVEWHVGYHDDELLSYCRMSDIQLQGYSAFGRLKHGPSFTQNNVVVDIAKNNHISPEQLLATWSVQSDVATLVTPDKIDVISNKIKFQKNLRKRDVALLNNIYLKNKNRLRWLQMPFE